MTDRVDAAVDAVAERSRACVQGIAKKMIRNRRRLAMAQMARKLAREAQISFRLKLRVELDRLAHDYKKELETLNRESVVQEPLEAQEDSEDNDFMSELLRANTDVLKKYHILDGDDYVEAESDNGDSSTTVRPRSQVHGPPATQMEPAPRIMDSLADELADGVSSDACPESGGNKDWLRDDDNPGGPDCPNLKALSHVSVPNSPCVSTGKITQSSPVGQHQRKSTQRPGLVNSDEAEEVQPKAQRPKAVPYIGYLHTVIPPFRPGDRLGPPQVSYPSPSAMSLRDRSESLLRLEAAEKRRRDALLYRQPFVIRPTASQPLASSNASGSTNPRPPTSFIPVPSPERSPGRLVASGSGPGSGGRAARNADLGL